MIKSKIFWISCQSILAKSILFCYRPQTRVSNLSTTFLPTNLSTTNFRLSTRHDKFIGCAISASKPLFQRNLSSIFAVKQSIFLCQNNCFHVIWNSTPIYVYVKLHNYFSSGNRNRIGKLQYTKITYIYILMGSSIF